MPARRQEDCNLCYYMRDISFTFDKHEGVFVFIIEDCVKVGFIHTPANGYELRVAGVCDQPVSFAREPGIRQRIDDVVVAGSATIYYQNNIPRISAAASMTADAAVNIHVHPRPEQTHL